MAFVNFNAKEITAKIVYYGPGLGGKTSSLQYIYNNLPEENRGKMISLATDEDRTIYFDFLPLHLGKIQNFTVKVQLYTVPGQVRYNATRKLVLKGVDGIVFVADSQIHRKFSNIESYSNLEENLAGYHKGLKDVAHVIQYNKIDLPNIIRSEELNQIINKYNAAHFETCAITGIGIMDSLKTISKMVFSDLSKKGITSKSYLMEKQTPADEFEITEEPEKQAFEPEEPHNFKDIDQSQEVIEREEVEELSTDDVEIIHEDLKLIEPGYSTSESKEIADVFESEDIIKDEAHIEPQMIIQDQEFQEKRGEIEFEPEHFNISADPSEKVIAEEPAKKSASFEEFEEIGGFHELEPESAESKNPASGKEEDAFSEFLDEAIPSDQTPSPAEEEIKTETAHQEIIHEDIPENLLAEEAKDETVFQEPLIPEPKQDDLFSGEIFEEEQPIELLEVPKPEEVVPETIISEEAPKENFISEEMLKDLSTDEMQFEEPAETKEALSFAPVPEQAPVPAEKVPEQAIKSMHLEEPEVLHVAEISVSFSYSSIIENEKLKSAITLLELSILNNDYNEIYDQASFIFSEITSLLTSKFKFCDPKSQAELLWLIGIQPNDYYLFIKNLGVLKEQKQNIHAYYIHNFLINLLFKSQLIPLQ